MSLHKITTETNDEYYIFSMFNSDLETTDVQVTNGGTSFTVNVTMEELRLKAQEIDMEYEKYNNLFKEAIGVKSSTNQFSYSLKEDQDICKFCWKQSLDGGMKFQLGSIDLAKENEESKNILTIFDSLSTQLLELKKENEELLSNKLKIENDQKRMNKRLESYAEYKNDIEKHLYSKFSLVLNEKKDKIRELHEALANKGETSSKKGKPSKIITHNEDEISASESDDYNTDDDEPKLSPSEVAESSKIPDIILDEQIAVDDDKPKKNRKRIRASRPKTPTSTVIPRTSSLPRPKRQSSSGSNKGESKRRNMAEEINAEDLLDAL